MGDWICAHRGYADKLVGHSKAACVEQLRDRIGELLGQAQEFGRIGPDVAIGDIMALIWGLRGVVETSGAVAPDAWRRYADIHLAGLRAPGAPGARPPVTREQLTAISGEAAASVRHPAAKGGAGPRA